MTFLSLLLLAALTYLVWRITDQLPDLIFRISEIQRDVAELRRTLSDESPRVVAPPISTPRRTETEAASDAAL